MTPEHVSASHIGYLCDARKVAVVRSPQSSRFIVQDMARIEAAPLGASSPSFVTVLDGTVDIVDSPLGRFGLCDFSTVTRPGIYRVFLPDSGARTYQFAITDGVYHALPGLFVDFMHGMRSGYFSNDVRRASNVDDGVRSDTGADWDATGGWYDAGDLRKWMNHSTLPALAFFEVSERLALKRRAIDDPLNTPNDWLTEAAWGVRFIQKMQDPESGMIFEDVGGGSTSRRKPGMSWWYENHSGCYADNYDNRFTDNLRQSGDERSIRVQYNPITQYTNITILARAFSVYAPHNAELAQRSHAAALAAWAFVGNHVDEEEHTWTAVRAWRLCAALELYRAGLLTAEPVETAFAALLANFDPALGFWRNAAGSSEPYRAILHSAQPLIALAKYLELIPSGPSAQRARETLLACKRDYVDPLTQTNPFRFMPFGVYSQATTPDDVYHPWREGRVFRFCMPVNHPQQINHGLGGHWMSWAHGLAYAGQVLNDPSWSPLAFAQIEWLTGNNPIDVSFISGVGFNNPMPHSRFLGTMIGGFMNGFCGTVEDVPAADLERDAEWNSTEYWNTPLSNCLMALACLLPSTVLPVRKLG